MRPRARSPTEHALNSGHGPEGATPGKGDDLLGKLHQKEAGRSMSGPSIWISRFPVRTAPRLRLFCLPYAGGGAGIFRDYHEGLPADVEVCAIQLPGRERRFGEPAYQSVGPLVETLAGELANEIDVPFFIFGHSLGALLGFELARELRRSFGAQPVSLIASAHRAPQIPDPDPPIHDLPDEQFISEIKDLEGTPPEVFESPEILELLMPMLRADFCMTETYEYREEPPLDCRLRVFGGSGDEVVTGDQLGRWRELTTGPFELHVFQGGHFFIHEQHAELMAALCDEIRRAA